MIRVLFEVAIVIGSPIAAGILIAWILGVL